MDQHPDIQLLNDLINGSESESEKAFSAIYLKYHKDMRRLAIYKLGNTYAEDAVQDIFTSFWKRRTDLKIEGTALKHYLFSSIIKKMLDAKKSDEHQDKYIKVQQDAQQEDEPPNAKMENDEFKKWIKVALEDKSMDTYREPFKLRYIDDRSFKEIAEQLNISTPVARTYVNRGLKFIRKIFPGFSVILLCFIFSIDFIIQL